MKKVLLFVAAFAMTVSLAFGAKVNVAKYAKVISKRGAATLYSGRTVRRAIKVGDLVLLKDKIVTGSGARVTIKIQGFGVFTIKGNSRVVISQLVNRGGTMNMNMSKGKMMFGVKKSTSGKTTVKVRTPSAVAAVKGTSFYIGASKEKGTEVAVLTGTVEMTGKDGKKVVVDELKHASVASDGATKTATRINKEMYGNVKEIATIEDIGTIKDVGDLQGNLEKLSLQLKDFEDTSKVGSAKVDVESTETSSEADRNEALRKKEEGNDTSAKYIEDNENKDKMIGGNEID